MARGIPRITSKRVKALIFAVVARVWVVRPVKPRPPKLFGPKAGPTRRFSTFLTYLTSNKLDAFERKVLSFARETVRYQTRRLQALAQTFATGLRRELLLEIIGVVSYANGVARMSILLHRC